MFILRLILDGPETSRERNLSIVGHSLEDADCPITYFNLSLVSTAPVSEQGLLKISMQNFLWVNLAIALNIDSGERQCINSDHPKLQQKKLHMLLQWKEQNGDVATYQKIADLAENIIDIGKLCWYTFWYTVEPLLTTTPDVRTLPL